MSNRMSLPQDSQIIQNRIQAGSGNHNVVTVIPDQQAMQQPRFVPSQRMRMISQELPGHPQQSQMPPFKPASSSYFYPQNRVQPSTAFQQYPTISNEQVQTNPINMNPNFNTSVLIPRPPMYQHQQPTISAPPQQASQPKPRERKIVMIVDPTSQQVVNESEINAMKVPSSSDETIGNSIIEDLEKTYQKYYEQAKDSIDNMVYDRNFLQLIREIVSELNKNGEFVQPLKTKEELKEIKPNMPTTSQTFRDRPRKKMTNQDVFMPKFESRSNQQNRSLNVNPSVVKEQEIEALQQENKQLHETNNSMKQESKQLHEANNSMKQENKELHEIIEVLQTTVVEGAGVQDKRVVELEKVNKALLSQINEQDEKILILTKQFDVLKKEKETEIRELIVNQEQAMQEISNIKQAFDEQKESMHILKTDFDKVDEDNKILIKGMSDKEAEISRLKEDLLQVEQSASNLIKSSRDAIDEARRSKEELEKAVLGRQEMERKIAVEKSEMKQKILTLKQEWETLVKQNYKREMTTATERFRSMLSAQNLGFLEFKALEEWDDRSFSIPESSSISRASSSFDVVSDVDSVRTLEEEKDESP